MSSADILGWALLFIGIAVAWIFGGGLGAGLAFVIGVMLLAVATYKKRREETEGHTSPLGLTDYTVQEMVRYFKRAIGKQESGLAAVPIAFNAVIYSANYPEGTMLDGIKWSNRFTEIRVSILNRSKAVDYMDLDLWIRPEGVIAEIVQASNVPTVRFTSIVDLSTRTQLLKSTGERLGSPLVLVATDAGYRMQCEKLHKKSRIEILMAAVSMAAPKVKPELKPDGGIFDRDFLMRFGFKRNDVPSKEYGVWYGHGSDSGGRIEDGVFDASRPSIQSITIEGSYRVNGEILSVLQTVGVFDGIASAIGMIKKRSV